MYPSESDLSQLLIDVVEQYGWTHLTVLYEAPFYSKRIGQFLEYRNDKPGKTSIQPLEVGTNSNFRKVLQRIKNLDDQSKNIIIESSVEHLFEILEQVWGANDETRRFSHAIQIFWWQSFHFIMQALQVGLFTPDRCFIITNLDAQTIDLEPFKYTEANITLFRLIDYDSNEKKVEREGIYKMLEEKRYRCELEGLKCSQDDMEGENKITSLCVHLSKTISIVLLNLFFLSVSAELKIELWPISSALIYDAVMILAETLKSIGFDFLDIQYEQEIDCFDAKSNFRKGYTIENFIKTVRPIDLYAYRPFQVQREWKRKRSSSI